jgi:hypothetical protein
LSKRLGINPKTGATLGKCVTIADKNGPKEPLSTVLSEAQEVLNVTQI